MTQMGGISDPEKFRHPARKNRWLGSHPTSIPVVVSSATGPFPALPKKEAAPHIQGLHPLLRHGGVDRPMTKRPDVASQQAGVDAYCQPRSLRFMRDQIESIQVDLKWFAQPVCSFTLCSNFMAPLPGSTRTFSSSGAINLGQRTGCESQQGCGSLWCTSSTGETLARDPRKATDFP